VLFQRGRLRRAEGIARNHLATHPDDPVALRVLARARCLQGRFDEAAEFGERAVAAAPRSADAHFALGLVSGSRAQRARIIHKAALARRFRKEMETALALDPRHADALVGMIEFHRQAPGIVGGSLKKADEFVDRLMTVDPTRAWLVKAEIAIVAGDSGASERCLREAVAIGQPRARLALATFLDRPWRNPDESARLALEVVAAEPWSTGAWALLASHEAARRRYPELEATLARAEAAVPENLEPHYRAARELIREGGDAIRAEALLRRYLEVEPEIGGPSHAAARWQLGLALERQGRRAEALAEVSAAVRMDPKLEAARKDLKRLRR
jgi:tetratricopeptide (TPR) repeat protein